jgi:hypothetical protein
MIKKRRYLTGAAVALAAVVAVAVAALLLSGQGTKEPGSPDDSALGLDIQDAQAVDLATGSGGDGAADETAALADSAQQGYSVAPKGSLDASYDLKPQDVASSLFFFVGTITDVKAVQEFTPPTHGVPMFSEGFITVVVKRVYQGGAHEAGETVVLYCAKANETDAQLGPAVAAGQAGVFFAFAVDEETRTSWAEHNPQYAPDFQRCTLALENTTGSMFPVREGIVCAPRGTDELFAPSQAMGADEEAAFTQGLRADGGSFVGRAYYTIDDFADIAAFSATTLKAKADEYLAAQG